MARGKAARNRRGLTPAPHKSAAQVRLPAAWLPPSLRSVARALVRFGAPCGRLPVALSRARGLACRRA